MGLVAAGGGVFWCFLFILGYSQTVLGSTLGAVAIVGLFGLYVLNMYILDYERHEWKKKQGSSARSERQKLYIALGLWIFILLFFGTLILMHRR